MVVAKEGFEAVFQELMDKKAKLIAEKEEAIKIACEDVNAKYAEREALIDEILAKVSYDVPECVEADTESDLEVAPEVAQATVEVTQPAQEQFTVNDIFDEE